MQNKYVFAQTMPRITSDRDLAERTQGVMTASEREYIQAWTQTAKPGRCLETTMGLLVRIRCEEDMAIEEEIAILESSINPPKETDDDD